MNQTTRLWGRRTLGEYLVAFYDGDELLAHERHELIQMAEAIIAHAAHGWPQNGPRALEDALIHFRPEDFTS